MGPRPKWKMEKSDFKSACGWGRRAMEDENEDVENRVNRTNLKKISKLNAKQGWFICMSKLVPGVVLWKINEDTLKCIVYS